MTTNLDFNSSDDPWILFREWYTLAEKHEPDDPNAMALATAGDDGCPSVRMVLLKSYSEGAFVFFTNRQSRKGEQLRQNPKAALCLHWKSLDRQIRVEGLIDMVPDAESDAYFAVRSRASQIGAWVSQQSRPLANRAVFEVEFARIERQYEGKQVPRPPYWGGYRLLPLRIEFWQERPFRLHDRIVYYRPGIDTKWAVERLYP